jgi:hypothetical protein
MFFMTSESEAMHRENNKYVDKILVQRLHILRLLNVGIAVTILKGTQFRDSKVIFLVGLETNPIYSILSKDYVFCLRTHFSNLGHI